MRSMVRGLAVARPSTALSGPLPCNAGEDIDPVRAVRGAPARWRLGRVPAGPDRARQAVAVGPGADGDPRKRADPPAGPASRDLIHVEARDARDALWAMEEGVRCAALSAVIGELWGDPRALDFTATRRLAVAAERSGVPCWLVRLGGTANLSGARMRWRIAIRAIARQPARSARAGSAGVGRRAVPGARACRRAAGASTHEADRFPSGCRTWRSSAGRRRATYRLTRRSSSPSRARTG